MTMTPTMTILYVDNTRISASFYQQLFDHTPVEVSDTFGLFVLPSGLVLGLWSRHTVEPATSITGGGCELAIRTTDPKQVDATFATWQNLGVTVLQPPINAEFGRTFAIADPDGHRIRVFNPPA
jgi:predicted enzyme related to lactoylglutathione lyase